MSEAGEEVGATGPVLPTEDPFAPVPTRYPELSAHARRATLPDMASFLHRVLRQWRFPGGARTFPLPGRFLVPALFALGAAHGCVADPTPGADPPGAVSTPVPPPPAVVGELEVRYSQVRVPGLEVRTFAPEEWWDAVLPMVEGTDAWRMEEVGRSAEGRPLRLLTFGSGEIPVLLWSQMHGDESTASMALADLIHLLAANPDDTLVQLLDRELTLHLLPVMNPDGAARFQRRSAQGVDLNRDARALATPEGRVLKALQERFEPAFGFNLHDQAVGTRVGDTDRGTAIALLAPPYNPEREVNPVRRRAMEVAAVIRTALEHRVGGYMAKWDDSFNPRAFGDLMTAWGVSTVLIESGGWEGDPQKQFLRELNFVALGAALEAIARGSHEGVDVALYEELPENGRRFGDLLIRGATLHAPGVVPLQGDVLVNFQHPLSEQGGFLADVGDLAEVEAREILDAQGLHLLASELQVGAPAHFQLARDAAGRDVLLVVEGDLEGRRP